MTKCIWDERHLRALLQLKRAPAKWLEVEPWRAWIEAHGGLSAVRAYLHECELAPEQRALLETILSHPHAGAEAHALVLHIALPTYFKRLRHLMPALLQHLNRWDERRNRPPPPSPIIRRPPNNLPAPLTSFVGGEETITAVCDLLCRPAMRLVTLTGPGGIGKTRLALQAAANLCGAANLFPDGVFFVPLASLTEPELTAAHIARALRIPETGRRSPQALLIDYARPRRLLLVLDNFEHILPAAMLVADVLAAAPQVKFLVGSRALLNLPAEHEFAVPALLFPDQASISSTTTPAKLANYPAVRLFVERAQAAQAGFELTEANAWAVAAICARLDGLPLAIELAAALIDTHPVEQILLLLERRLTALTEGACDLPPRQRSLRGALDWSYNLLAPPERLLFRHLAVFANGWDAAAAGAVCGATASTVTDALARLRHQSLIGGTKRFDILDTIREYALEHLTAAGEATAARQRHACHYLALAETAEPHLAGPNSQEWLDRLDDEHENLRTALEWAATEKETETALRLAAALWRYWQIRSYLSEGRHWMERVLNLPGGQCRSLTACRIRALWGGGWLTINSDLPHSLAWFGEGLALARECGDRRSVGRILHGLGEAAQLRGEYKQSEEFFQESLDIFRELQDDEETAWTLNHLARLARDRGEAQRAYELSEAALMIFRRLEHKWGIALGLDELGLDAFGLGRYRQSIELHEAALMALEQLGTKWLMAFVLYHLGRAEFEAGNRTRAHRLYLESLNLHCEMRSPIGIGLALEGIAAVALAAGDAGRAARLCAQTEALFAAEGNVRRPLEDLRRHERLRNAIRERLTPEAFEREWLIGCALNAEQAAKEAREE